MANNLDEAIAKTAQMWTTLLDVEISSEQVMKCMTAAIICGAAAGTVDIGGPAVTKPATAYEEAPDGICS